MCKLIPVYMSCDDNYVTHLCVVIASVLSNTKSDLHFIILVSSLSEHNKRVISEVCGNHKVSFIDVKQKLQSIPIEIKCSHISLDTCSRFFISEFTFQYKKGIYLDCDVVVNGDIAEYFDIDIGDNYVAAVDDFVSREYTKKLGIDRYFNAGVLLLNIEKMRNENIVGSFFDAIKVWGNAIKYADQDILNVAFRGKVLFVPPKYGVVAPYFRGRRTSYFSNNDVSEAIYNPLIIHFTGPDKPWVIPFGITAHPWTPLYFYYLRKTPFADLSIEYNKRFKVFRRLLWYWKRHLGFFLRPKFYTMRLLYLRNKKRFKPR